MTTGKGCQPLAHCARRAESFGSTRAFQASRRRLTRLTNAFSKKWENLKAMLALYFCWYN